MTSRDFGFLTLRNTIAYQPNGNPVPPNNVFITSTNGASIFSNNVNINTLNVGTVSTSSIITPIQLYNSTNISDNYGKTVLLRNSTINTIGLTTSPINNTSINFINQSGAPYSISTSGAPYSISTSVSTIIDTNTLVTGFYIDGLGWIVPSFYRN